MNLAKNCFKIFFLIFCFSFFSLFFKTNAESNPFGIDIDLNAHSIYFLNTDSNTVVLSKNENAQYPCSALAKIMTVILILECRECRENPKKFLRKEITASSQIFDRLYLKGASNANIKKGETITVQDALYATMVQSACETTMMLVEMMCKQDTQTFVNMMNEKAKDLKMKNTYFTDPDGLDTTNQYTSAYDMFLLIRYCLKNPLFKQIATASTYTIPPTNLKQTPTKLTHTNKILSKFLGGKYHDSRVKGIKTAKVEDSDNLISIASEKSYNYMLIMLGCPKIKNETTVFKETKELYDWAFKNLKLKIIATPEEKTIPNNIQVNMSKNSNGVILTPKEQVAILLPKSIDESTIYWDISSLPKKIDAPIKKGKEIGTISLKLSDQEVGKVLAIAAQDVEVDIISFISNLAIKILTSWWFITIAILLLILTAWLFLKNKFSPKKNKIKHIKNKKREKKYRPFK